jgi:hypothetical protein
MLKKLKVDVKQGVYLHCSGEVFTVEFGAVSNEDGLHPAIKTYGCNRSHQEVCKIFRLDEESTVVQFVMVINGSEYLGEL